MYGWISTVTYARVFFVNEAKGTLYPVIKLKEMYGKLSNPSQQETASFLYFLKIALYVREAGFFAIWLPMIVFRGIGAVVSAYSFNSVIFLVAFIPVFIVHMITQPYPYQVRAYTHLLIAQSTTYFQLRLSRVKKSLSTLVIANRLKRSHTEWIKTINSQLIVLEEILNEVRDHNECIKYWLRDELAITGGYVSFFLVLAVGPIAWYYKMCTAVSAVFWGGMLGPSFINSALLYLRIQSLAKRLHSCQNHIHLRVQSRCSSGAANGSTVINRSHSSFQGRTKTKQQTVNKIRSRSNSASVLHDNDVHPMVIIKTKYQVMRMIHRVSSPFLKIGYTKGDGESFSPTSISQTISTVLFNTLMFVNVESSVKNLLNM